MLMILFSAAINAPASAIWDRDYWETCKWTVGWILWPCWPLTTTCRRQHLGSTSTKAFTLLCVDLKWWASEMLKIAWSCKVEHKPIWNEITCVILLTNSQPSTCLAYHSGTAGEVLASSPHGWSSTSAVGGNVWLKEIKKEKHRNETRSNFL